jgi:TatD DNase family protein
MKYIDIHTHYSNNQEDTIAVLNLRAGTDDPESIDSGFVSYGIHPWDTEIYDSLKPLSEIICSKNLVFIGECGMDNTKGADLTIQEKVFRLHVEASEEFHKPLIIHCIGNFNELIHLRQILKPLQPWIIHGFTAHHQLANQLVKAGFSLSFGDALLMQNSKAVASLKTIPEGSWFLETDASTASIKEIYKAAAKIRNTTIINLKKLIYNRFKNLIKL